MKKISLFVIVCLTAFSQANAMESKILDEAEEEVDLGFGNVDDYSACYQSFKSKKLLSACGRIYEKDKTLKRANQRALTEHNYAFPNEWSDTNEEKVTGVAESKICEVLRLYNFESADPNIFTAHGYKKSNSEVYDLDRIRIQGYKYHGDCFLVRFDTHSECSSENDIDDESDAITDYDCYVMGGYHVALKDSDNNAITSLKTRRIKNPKQKKHDLLQASIKDYESLYCTK